jgi:hypothetical protein
MVEAFRPTRDKESGMTYLFLGKTALGKTAFGKTALGKTARAVASGVIGLALAAGLAAPALADTVPDPAPDPTPQSVTDFTNVTDDGTARDVSPSTNGSHFATPQTVIGRRQTFTRGSSLAWSSDTFEWYWSGSSMTSSTASQARGYVAPNKVTLNGVKRTLTSSSQHLWRATATISEGIPSPWGTVVFYSSTVTDYFTLTPGKLTHSTN